MIKSFRSEDTQQVFEREAPKKFKNIERQAYRKLGLLHNANDLLVLSTLPGNHLEKLRGHRKGQYSIRINDQWRICFHWSDGNAYDVEIVDYH